MKLSPGVPDNRSSGVTKLSAVTIKLSGVGPAVDLDSTKLSAVVTEPSAAMKLSAVGNPLSPGLI